MSESVYLHKPMLAMPVVGQFEQTLNALYLEREGFGRYARSLDDSVLSAFLQAVPLCEERLNAYVQDGNRLLLGALDELLDGVAAGL
jgi:UDP:flavonoid glycosyltransferase YjiC (YdhE family)